MKVLAYEIRVYEAVDGHEPFTRWLGALKNAQTRGRIRERITRLAAGHFGDYKWLKGANGVHELRLHFGPGYRIYFGMDDEVIVVLLCGGDKSSQERDIRRAIAYWDEYKQRSIQ